MLRAAIARTSEQIGAGMRAALVRLRGPEQLHRGSARAERAAGNGLVGRVDGEGRPRVDDDLRHVAGQGEGEQVLGDVLMPRPIAKIPASPSLARRTCPRGRFDQ